MNNPIEILNEIRDRDNAGDYDGALEVLKNAIAEATEETAEHFRQGLYRKLHEAMALVRATAQASEDEVIENERMVKGRTKAGDELRAAQAEGSPWRASEPCEAYKEGKQDQLRYDKTVDEMLGSEPEG